MARIIIGDDAWQTAGAPDDPSTSLYFAGALQAGVGGSKRIGPYPNAGPGSNDTHDIRATAEELPQ